MLRSAHPKHKEAELGWSGFLQKEALHLVARQWAMVIDSHHPMPVAGDRGGATAWEGMCEQVVLTEATFMKGIECQPRDSSLNRSSGLGRFLNR